MSDYIITSTILVSLLCSAAFYSEASEREILLNQYAKQASNQGLNQENQAFSSARGKTLWRQSVKGQAPFPQRSCTTCHGNDLEREGKHVRTNKTIIPLAPSVNPSSLIDAEKIEKWFKRNCKWTLGRECSPQEKGNILTYLQSQ